jgi:hypothetical protein
VGRGQIRRLTVVGALFAVMIGAAFAVILASVESLNGVARSAVNAERAVNLASALERANANAASWHADVAETAGIAWSILAFGLFTLYVGYAIIRLVRQVAVMADQIAEGDLSRRMPEDRRY